MHHPLQLTFIRGYFKVVSRLFPSLAVLSAHKIFHHPVNTKRKNANEKPLPTPEKYNIVLNEHTTLQAYRWGDKGNPIVLLVHGWSTTSKSMSHFADALLRANYQVISYDALRHGDSKGGFSDLSDWADSVQAVTKDIGQVECIIAHSFGGAAVTVASKLGLNTKKLVLIAPIHDVVSVADNFATHLHIPLEIAEKMRTHTWKNHEENFLKYGKDWHDLFASDFHVPTLIFHDEDDREIGIEHSELLCKRWPWATLIPTKDLGHRKILDDEAVVKETLAFIEESDK